VPHTAADAARLLGSADAWYAAHGDDRLPNEAQLEQQAHAIILPSLGQTALQALRAQGAALADAQVRRLSLAVIAGDGG
jgi:predicted Fe-Mo cluster-binding NifX family protein